MQDDLKERTKHFALRIVRLPAKNTRWAGARQTIAPLRKVRWGKLQGSVSRTKQSEFVAKCGDSLRELEESAYWLKLLIDGGNVASGQTATLAKRNVTN